MPRLTPAAVAYPGSSLAFKTGDWRVERPEHRHRPAPCHAACPAGEDAQAYLAYVELERFREAWETLVAANPLPAITGRVCHHPCEQACNRGQYDEAIAIHHVERFLGDEAIAHDWPYPIEPVPADAPEVAVVGSGPAGLSCAYHLLRQGLRPVVFEALPMAGGLLRSAIPAYRLPRETLDAEISRLLAAGIRFQGETRLGRDVALDELRRDYAAVFLAVGLQKPRDWSVGGMTPSDLHPGLDLLKEWMEVGEVPEWRSVAIVGAGNTAVDLARIMRRAGIPEVHIISHKAIPGRGAPPEDTMPAIPREVHQALEEGVQIHEHRGVQRLILRGERVVGIEMVHMKKLPGPDGRLHRVPFEGTEHILHVDQVIPAVGQEVDPEGLETILDGRHWLPADEWGRLEGRPGIYVGGDVRGDHGTVTEAVGDGRRAALAIARAVRGQGLPQERSTQPIAYTRINTHYFEHRPRPADRVVPPQERSDCREIELGLERAEVLAEGQRCFSCGNCMACDNCWTLCPDSAVLKARHEAEGGDDYVFDYEFCKGCGLCAHECPCGYIDMVPETV